MDPQQGIEKPQALQLAQPFGVHPDVPFRAKSDELVRPQQRADAVGLAFDEEVGDPGGQPHAAGYPARRPAAAPGEPGRAKSNGPRNVERWTAKLATAFAAVGPGPIDGPPDPTVVAPSTATASRAGRLEPMSGRFRPAPSPDRSTGMRQSTIRSTSSSEMASPRRS
jgi:hypothetical protein